MLRTQDCQPNMNTAEHLYRHQVFIFPLCAARRSSLGEVLNLYHYFNSPTCDEEPCRSHADPGLLTVLGRSTKAGLQAVRPLTPGKVPGRPASYGEEWLDLELLMDDLGRGSAAGQRGEIKSGLDIDDCEIVNEIS